MTTLKPQIPAEGIMKTGEFGDSKHYRIACKCGQPADDLRINIEADDVEVTMHTWTTVQTCWWKERFNTFDSINNPLIYTLKKWANDIMNRAYIIWTVLTKGYVEMESWTVMDEQQTLNFANTLIAAAGDVKHFRAKRDNRPSLCAPFPGMEVPWTEEKKQELATVLNDIYEV